ncbi:hypothetical protein HYDPIDRAFT_101369 [Hydnomerulius pinastri MD-312]|uniref:Uncharacterized protein n=1 Tax=Hydnomerulius pinastri MD-312 TaxID=994086 RepID=A0A0C9VN48_9AGAM|nr:hypothetical protein HYDPIDRAFT_101369 [Hydnomerulius pinastri MD-312]
MGSLLSFISPETVVAAVITGAAVYGYVLYSNSGTQTATSTIPNQKSTGTKSSKAKKKKPSPKIAELSDTPEKAALASRSGNSAPEPVVVPFPHVIPGEFEAHPATANSDEPVTKSKKGKKKKAKGTSPADSAYLDSASPLHTSHSGDAPSSSTKSQGNTPAATMDVPPQTKSHLRASASFDTDSSWTQVEPQHQKGSKSAGKLDGQTLAVSTDFSNSDFGASISGDSPVTERTDEVAAGHEIGTRGDDNRRTLAEKLVPKPRKTGVDDMLQRSDFPTLARVMRVQPRADETPAPGFTWEDYEDVAGGGGNINDANEEDDGGWGVVKGKGSSRNSRTISTLEQPSDGASDMTKKQRQNAKKRELAKAAKADAEAARLAGLAKHKRELERQRIAEISRQGGGKLPSGGMQASVDDRGRLVWD